MGFFLFGLAAVKSGIIADASAPIWRKARRFYLPFGIFLSLLAAYVMHAANDPMSGQGMLGMALVFMASPLASFGYMGLIAKWASGPSSAFKTFMARGGTATLSIYLLQSLILAWVFNGYGLSLYGKIGAAACIGIALVTGITTLVAMSLWRKKFERGPFEVVLRWFIYLGHGR